MVEILERLRHLTALQLRGRVDASRTQPTFISAPGYEAERFAPHIKKADVAKRRPLNLERW
ncbi:hypothetical protein C1D09_014165 [Mesorhizobium intechi]|uniref:hypothetical protein n=1 Tax=Mesorhizobium intechi TaxID=537601 RepID=UPI000CC43727|nr:hypothetical protein [Mesorhizobium intechi]TSE10886.1 hypothetical protein C1D09_014165 [Mesorhizobium intechi]